MLSWLVDVGPGGVISCENCIFARNLDVTSSLTNIGIGSSSSVSDSDLLLGLRSLPGCLLGS